MTLRLPRLALLLLLSSGCWGGAWHRVPDVGVGYLSPGDLDWHEDRSPHRSSSGEAGGRWLALVTWRGYDDPWARDYPYWGSTGMPAAWGATSPQMPRPNVDAAVQTAGGAPSTPGEGLGAGQAPDPSTGAVERLAAQVTATVPKDANAVPWGWGILLACLGLGVLLWGLKGFPGLRRRKEP